MSLVSPALRFVSVAAISFALPALGCGLVQVQSGSSSPSGGGGSGKTTQAGLSNGGPAVAKDGAAKPVPATNEPRHVAASVVKLFPQFTPDDSYDLTKVVEALKLVRAEQVYSPKGYIDDHKWRPSPRPTNTPTEGYASSCEDKGIEHFGGYVNRYRYNGVSSLKLGRCTGAAVPAGTPGVIWSARGDEVVFVSFDGMRFEVNQKSLQLGVPAREHWKLLRPQYLRAWEMIELGKLGQADAAETGKKLDDTSKAWGACAEALWERAEGEHKANNAAILSWSTKQARGEQINDRYYKLIGAQCAKHKDAFEKAAISYFSAREKLKIESLEAAKARLAP